MGLSELAVLLVPLIILVIIIWLVTGITSRSRQMSEDISEIKRMLDEQNSGTGHRN